MSRPVLEAAGLLPCPPWHVTTALDLQLVGGQVCGLIGPDQPARSAWLRVLGAVDRPQAGALRLAGVDCASLTPAQWRQLRRRVGYVTPGAPLLSVVNGMANVVLGAQYHQLGDPATLTRKAHAILDKLGWQGPLDALPAYLDAHQRHLLSFARTLMLDPVLLFVNEPFQMSASARWSELASVLHRLAQEEGLTLVIATSHLRFVQAEADQVLFIGGERMQHFAGWQALVGAMDSQQRAFLSDQGVTLTKE